MNSKVYVRTVLWTIYTKICSARVSWMRPYSMSVLDSESWSKHRWGPLLSSTPPKLHSPKPPPGLTITCFCFFAVFWYRRSVLFLKMCNSASYHIITKTLKILSMASKGLETHVMTLHCNAISSKCVPDQSEALPSLSSNTRSLWNCIKTKIQMSFFFKIYFWHFCLLLWWDSIEQTGSEVWER